MGLVLQTQRRANENAYTEMELVIEYGDKFILIDKELHLLGISEGIGTCSDKHGVNIAVFSDNFPFDPNYHRLPSFPIDCRGAVLIRKPTREETEKLSTLNSSLAMVEGLIIKSVDQTKRIIYVKLNGITINYVPLA